MISKIIEGHISSKVDLALFNNKLFFSSLAKVFKSAKTMSAHVCKKGSFTSKVLQGHFYVYTVNQLFLEYLN